MSQIKGVIGFVIGFSIVAYVQSQQGWTDGSWDLLRIGGAILMGGLPGYLIAKGMLKH